jgi:hypothetical protein
MALEQQRESILVPRTDKAIQQLPVGQRASVCRLEKLPDVSKDT